MNKKVPRNSVSKRVESQYHNYEPVLICMIHSECSLEADCFIKCFSYISVRSSGVLTEVSITSYLPS